MANKVGLVAFGVLLGAGGMLAVQGAIPEDGPRVARRVSPAGDSETSEASKVPPTLVRESSSKLVRSSGARDLPAEAGRFLRRINEAALWQGAQAAAAEIAELPPDAGLAIMHSIYARIHDAEKKRQILKPFVFGVHPHVLAILDLAVGADQPEVRDWGRTYASWFAYRAFADDGAYAAWRAGTERLPLTAVVDAGVRAFLRRLHRESPAVAADAWQWSPPWSRGGLEDFDGASVLRDENLPSLAEALLSQPLPADAAQRARAVSRREELWRWITLSEPDDAFARRVVLGAIDRDDALSGAAIKTLASLDRDWAFDALVERLRTPLVRSHAMAFGVALGNRGDPRAIPHMIAAIAANDVRGVRDGLGWFGLNMLSGRSGGRARWNTAPDAAWWLAWWDEHRMRYGARVRAIDPRALR